MKCSVTCLRPTRRSIEKAFTLVELLVVLGIVATLIAVLLPALAEVRRQAQLLSCAVNLRSTGQALFMYAQDNNGAFPPFIVHMGDTISPHTIDTVSGAPDWCWRNTWGPTGDPNWVYSAWSPWLRASTKGNGFYDLLWPRLIKTGKFFYCPYADYRGFYHLSYPSEFTIYDAGVRSGYNYNFLISTGAKQTVAANSNVTGGQALIYRVVTTRTKKLDTRTLAWDFGYKSGNAALYPANHQARGMKSNMQQYAESQHQLFGDGHVEFIKTSDSRWKDGT